MHWVAHISGAYSKGPKRVNHAAAAVGETIYTFGGYCTGDLSMYHSKGLIDVHALSIHHLVWREIPRPAQDSEQYSLAPFQRYGHTAVAYGKNIYIWGGRNDEFACNQLFVFNTETWLWSAPQTTGVIPCSRDGHSACVIDNQMFIFGGYEEEFERYSQDVYSLNLDTLCWTYVVTQGTPPECRDFHTSTAIGNRMYIFGGRSDPHNIDIDYYPNDVVYLDTDTRVWHRPEVRGEVPIGRRSHSAFLYGGLMYVFGGYNGLTKEHFNDLLRFCPVTNTWSEVETTGKNPNKRRRQVCIVIDDKMYLFGGTSPNLAQIAVRNERDYQDNSLLHHDDLHVLDFRPTLKLLCMLYILDNGLFVRDPRVLPGDIIKDVGTLKERLRNCLSDAKTMY
uniref:Kelch domain-containing protein 3 n=1 Tax=Lygus hesperus TaxID=30085 RepID=A0A0K8TG65_LYGHE